jgi:hypothetical protein
MPLAGFEYAIPASKRPQAHASAHFNCISTASCLKGRLKAKILYKVVDLCALHQLPLLNIYSHRNIGLDLRQAFRNELLA